MLRWLILLLVACDAGAPPKPPPKPVTPVAKAQLAAVPDAWAVPPAPAVSSRHKHGVRVADLTKPELGVVELPKHGVVLKSWGLEGDSTLILDADAGTLRERANLMDKAPFDRRRTITPALLARTMAAANAAWDEDQNGDMPSATDIREDLYVLDGDDAFYVSGYPIGAYGVKGRPAAARAIELLVSLAPDR
jgi:hypothetical protein